MILLQISSSQGPAECELAVAKALVRIEREALEKTVSLEIVEVLTGSKAGNYRSVLLALDGEQAEAIAQRWRGTVKWICKSPYRPRQERKNWFIGVAVFIEPPDQARCVKASEVKFEACRASGPGGQHVNKTDSAIRATHLPTGISVRVESNRSQHTNKRLAILLIEQKFQQAASRQACEDRAQRRIVHHQLERGNARLAFFGMVFIQL